jgi:nucleoside-diphosphate-sugar epimerase
MKKVIILGAAGRVGSQLIAELLRHPVAIVAVDIIPELTLSAMMARLNVDCRLTSPTTHHHIQVYGAVNLLN